MSKSVFLTAEWRHLLMLNYPVDPGILHPIVPPGTELDYFGDRTFLSVVGFQFLQTRVFGVSFPFHKDFEELNLRFYVRRKAPEGWRRGVVFVRELVPRAAIAFIARTAYGEPYTALPMRHKIETIASQIRVEYGWRRQGIWESIYGESSGEPREIEKGSEPEFITEHYWGYTARATCTNEYQVEHPRWRVWKCNHARFSADISTLYGADFVEPLSTPPSSSFIAEGSPVIVRSKTSV
jgi:uncharacterized protein YqjF (DUF2071 family)